MVLPSDLPFYSKEEKVEYAMVPQEPSALEDGVRMAREAMSEVGKQAGLLVDQVNHVVETGKAHTQGALFQLREEENLPARIGFIAGTGTAGLMLGLLRGRLIKRVLYTGIGAGIGASVCYPEEANEAMATVEKEGKKAVEMVQALANGGKLSEITLPSTTSATDMSLVAGRTIAHNIKIIVTFLGVASAAAYELAAAQIAVLVENWKFTKKLEIENETQGQQPKMNVPEIEVVTESGSEERSSSGGAKKSQVVFLTTATTVTGVEGDPGMATDEDKDLYTTRGN